MLTIILGPTASGKTDFSIKKALKINAEIVGADSVQIYKDLKIGAASPTKEEMKLVPHHLVGILDLNKEISAGIFSKMARDVIKSIENKKKEIILVGGTNFYVYSFLNGLSPIPEFSQKDVNDFREKLKQISTEILYEQLMKIDKIWAKSISNNDRQRILRGLEVFKFTQKPISKWNELPNKNIYKKKFLKIGLNIEREILYSRINLRAELMIKQGLIEEVESIKKKGFSP
jgi:tRNA dimethylallyltransferase